MKIRRSLFHGSTSLIERSSLRWSFWKNQRFWQPPGADLIRIHSDFRTCDPLLKSISTSFPKIQYQSMAFDKLHLRSYLSLGLMFLSHSKHSEIPLFVAPQETSGSLMLIYEYLPILISVCDFISKNFWEPTLNARSIQLDSWVFQSGSTLR